MNIVLNHNRNTAMERTLKITLIYECSTLALASVVVHNTFVPGPAGFASDWYLGGRGFDPPVRQHSFVEIGHEIISTAISPYRWFKFGSCQLLRLCTKCLLTA